MNQASTAPRAERGKGAWQAFRPLLPYFVPYRWPCCAIALALLVEVCVYTSVPFGFKLLVDRAVLQRDRQALGTIVAWLFGGVLAVAVAGVTRDFLSARVAHFVVRDLRADLFDHLQRLSLDYYRQSSTGDVLARFSSDVGAVEQAITAAIPWLIYPICDAVLGTVLLFVLDWRLALPAMLVWPICLLGPRILGKRASAASYQRKLAESGALSAVAEGLAARTVVKAFGLEERVRTTFAESNRELAARSVRVSFLGSFLERGASLGILVLQISLLALGGLLILRGVISLGTMAAFQPPFLALSYALMYGTQYLPTFVHGAGGMQRVTEVLRARPLVVDRPGAREMAPLARQIELRGVTVKDGGNVLLHRINLTVPHRAMIGLVGPSGSGKSTILGLLLRFYDPAEGAVLVDGVDLRDVTQGSLRRQVGIVFQETVLFNASIRENIRCGRLDATDDEVVAAATLAEIHEYILRLPEGYDTPAGERGSRFSGGERQRIGIARAILRDPSILLLDEVTSALDPRTQAGIDSTLQLLRRGRTVIMATHRMSAVADADRVYVINRGEIVESGTHAELVESSLQKGGLHAQFWSQTP